MTREELLSMAEIIERMVKRFEEQGAEHERMMGEHRISFGARTEADAKIIARLRSEVEASEGECNVLRPLVVDAAKYKTERDGLLTQVHDMRAEITRLTGNYDLLKTAAIVLAAIEGGKVQIAAGVTADSIGKVKAGELVNFVAQQVGGKGGGKPDMAMAGGTDAAAVPAALASVQAWVTERV